LSANSAEQVPPMTESRAMMDRVGADCSKKIGQPTQVSER
jgi:hypothetical protein